MGRTLETYSSKYVVDLLLCVRRCAVAQFLEQLKQVLVVLGCTEGIQRGQAGGGNGVTNIFSLSLRLAAYSQGTVLSTQFRHLGWAPSHLILRARQLKHALETRGLR